MNINIYISNKLYNFIVVYFEYSFLFPVLTQWMIKRNYVQFPVYEFQVFYENLYLKFDQQSARHYQMIFRNFYFLFKKILN